MNVIALINLSYWGVTVELLVYCLYLVYTSEVFSVYEIQKIWKAKQTALFFLDYER